MKTVRRGDRGPEVASWQRILNSGGKPTVWRSARGLLSVWLDDHPWPIPEDGVFGLLTERATESWQTERGLEADGVVGPLSWRAGGMVSMTPDLPPLLYGTDVSAIQGELDNGVWNALRDLGIRLAIFRAIVGNEQWMDRFAMNQSRAEDFGIVTGRYLFAYPLRHIDPRKQVEDWIRRLEDSGDDFDDGLPLALDQEWPPREEWKKNADGTKTLTYPWRDKWHLSAASIRDWDCAALERGRELTGRDLIFYSFPYHLDCIEASKAPELGRSPLWLANYTHKGRFPTPAQVAAYRVPKPWSEITIVQHDGDGGLTLPNGRDADFNVMTGGEARLRALTGRGAVPEATPAADPIDAHRARLAVAGALVDADVSRYRRERIEAELSAA